MKQFAKNVAKLLVEAGQNFLDMAKKNPVMARVAVMSALTALGVWTPEQLAGVERWIDGALPFVLLLMGAELRSQVIPANGSTGAQPKAAPVAGPSGAF